MPSESYLLEKLPLVSNTFKCYFMTKYNILKRRKIFTTGNQFLWTFDENISWRKKCRERKLNPELEDGMKLRKTMAQMSETEEYGDTRENKFTTILIRGFAKLNKFKTSQIKMDRAHSTHPIFFWKPLPWTKHSNHYDEQLLIYKQNTHVILPQNISTRVIGVFWDDFPILFSEWDMDTSTLFQSYFGFFFNFATP